MALTLKEQFSFSKLDTLALHGSFGGGRMQTSGNICTVYCSKDITCPPAEIAGIKEIREIRLEFCPRLNLVETFQLLADVPNLTNLQLKNCNIKELPPEIWALYKIRVLNLGSEGYGDNNEFITSPPEIEHLQQLQELNLHDIRQFRRFPPEVAQLKKLTHLNLRGFYKLPENIELIPHLASLYLAHSGLVPAHIEPLIDRPNGLKSVQVGEDYFSMFQKLTLKYPHFSVGWTRTSMRGNY